MVSPTLVKRTAIRLSYFMTICMLLSMFVSVIKEDDKRNTTTHNPLSPSTILSTCISLHDVKNCKPTYHQSQTLLVVTWRYQRHLLTLLDHITCLRAEVIYIFVIKEIDQDEDIPKNVFVMNGYNRSEDIFKLFKTNQINDLHFVYGGADWLGVDHMTSQESGRLYHGHTAVLQAFVDTKSKPPGRVLFHLLPQTQDYIQRENTRNADFGVIRNEDIPGLCHIDFSNTRETGLVIKILQMITRTFVDLYALDYAIVVDKTEDGSD